MFRDFKMTAYGIATLSFVLCWSCASIFIFSEMGIGYTVYEVVCKAKIPYIVPATGSLLSLLFMYLFNLKGIWHWVCTFITIGFATLAVCISSLHHPSMALLFSCTIVSATPLLIQRYDPKLKFTVVKYSAISMISTSIVIFCVFCAWVWITLPENHSNSTAAEWNSIQHWSAKLNCDEDDETCTLTAYLWWTFPVNYGLWLLLYGIGTSFVYYMIKSENLSLKILQLMSASFVILTYTLYVSASISVVGVNVSYIVVFAALIFMSVSIANVIISLGAESAMNTINSMETVQIIIRDMNNEFADWVRAVIISISIIPLAIWALLYLTKKALFGSVDKNLTVILEYLSNCHRGSILTKITLANLIFVMSYILMIAITLLLCFLTVTLREFPLYIIIVIVCAVGFVVFLIPVTPGSPLYLFAGILISASFVDDNSPGSEFWIGISIAFGVSAFIKFVSIYIQQQVIGRLLQSNVSVRVWCNVNTKFMRTVHIMLTQKGCTFEKSLILVSGPDWPTSVLTGILGLNPFEMLIGSIPVVLFILPSVLAGAFQLLEGTFYSVISNILIVFAILVEISSMITALIYVHNSTTKYERELEELPCDREVQQHTTEMNERNAKWRQCIDWTQPTIPLKDRTYLFIAAVTSLITSYLSLTTQPFHDVKVSDDFYGKPLNGNPFNAILPPGLLIFSSFIVSLSTFMFYRTAAMIVYSKQ